MTTFTSALATVRLTGSLRSSTIAFSFALAMVGQCVLMPLSLTAQATRLPAPLTTSDISPEELAVPNEAVDYIAHHAGEGGAGFTGLGAATTASSAIVTTTSNPLLTSASWSDSLWGNLLLSMAMQRDPELKRYLKRAKVTNTLTMISLLGVSGLGLAQSIYSYNHRGGETINVTEAHHGGGHDHVHLPESSKLPSTLGIIGSSTTIGVLTLRGIANWRTERKLRKRQDELQNQVDAILNQLTQGQPDETVRAGLVSLVGQRASDEFFALWHVVQPSPAT